MDLHAALGRGVSVFDAIEDVRLRRRLAGDGRSQQAERYQGDHPATPCRRRITYYRGNVRRSTTLVTPLVSRASAIARSRSAADRTVPLNVTVVPVVDTSIVRDFTESSSAIFALIFVVSAASATFSFTFSVAT